MINITTLITFLALAGAIIVIFAGIKAHVKLLTQSRTEDAHFILLLAGLWAIITILAIPSPLLNKQLKGGTQHTPNNLCKGKSFPTLHNKQKRISKLGV